MNRLRLARAGARHGGYRQLGLLLGVALTSAVLVGALAVGDSVRASLSRLATDRIGWVDVSLSAGDRWFRATLADLLTDDATSVAPALRLRGVAGTPDGSRRARDVQVLGIDERFFALGPAGAERPAPGAGKVFVNARLARQLDVAPGDSVVLRVERPSALPREAALASTDDATTALRCEVAAILDPEEFGRFGLEAGSVPPFNAFLSADWLATRLELEGRANLLLATGDGEPSVLVADRLDGALRAAITLDDLELEIVRRRDHAELRSPRVFLDHAVGEAVRNSGPPALFALTYFVNELRAGDRAAPYSTVTALGSSRAGEEVLAATAVVPGDLGDDEIVINEWLAEDLGAGPGDLIDLSFFVLDPRLQLMEESRSFRVRSVVPLLGLAADPDWMPAFPGLEDAENCRDWEPGIPVDLNRIRDEDEQYWDDHAGTPKAFVSLARGQELFGSRFGELTAIRVALERADELEGSIRSELDPATLGLFFEDRRTPALDGTRTTTDFGGLFLGLSLFLIAAALLLTTLIFLFGVEQRAAEIGTLLAIGFRPGQVRGLLLREAALVSILGAIIGVGIGLGYTQLILRALDGLWQGAVASTPILFHAGPMSVVGGPLFALLAALAALAWSVRRHVRRSPAELLAGGRGAGTVGMASRSSPGRGAAWLLVVASLAAVVVLLLVEPGTGPAAAGAFFGAGALALTAGLAGCRLLFARMRASRTSSPPTLSSLGRRNCARRPGRSLATVGLLAAGTFLVVAIGVNRLEAPRDATRRDSGTGGFTLLGRTSLPVLQDLNTAAGRDAFGLFEEDLEGVNLVSLRERDGDEASCLNLGRAQNPRLFGVVPVELAARGAFSFTGGAAEAGSGSSWSLLLATEESLLLATEDSPVVATEEGVIPAIGDAASVKWALHKSIGDTLEYTDEQGNPFQVKIVATVANSILQGMLVIDERHFRERFPGEGGYRTFLIDAPPERADEVSRTLSRALEDVGLEVRSTAERLAEFNAVQNTYLSIFQVLGALGVLLGTAGLGLVVLRNVLERRAELAACRAVGYSRSAIRRLLLGEHGLLLALGLLVGAVAALVAVLPGGRASLSAAPLWVVLAVALSGFLWVALAARVAVHGRLVDALRGE